MPYLYLFSLKNGEVQPRAGLNWGHADAHVNFEDGYIALPTGFFREYPHFFPPHGAVIEVEWDDGEIMNCLLEGTQQIDGNIYPKQISSYNDKSILGHYLRTRINVASTQVVTMNDLKKYGRDNIEVSYIDGNKYYFDFSI